MTVSAALPVQVVHVTAAHPESGVIHLTERQKHKPTDKKPPRSHSEAKTKRPPLLNADTKIHVFSDFINGIDPKLPFLVTPYWQFHHAVDAPAPLAQTKSQCAHASGAPSPASSAAKRCWTWPAKPAPASEKVSTAM